MPLYFAYGSCMSEDDIARTVKGATFLNTGRVLNHKLAFTRYSDGRKGGVADIVKCEGEYVEGILFIVPDFDGLDKREGHPYVYQRRRIRVYPSGQSSYIYAYTYEVVKKAAYEIKPSEAYLRLIRDGAKYLSNEYQTKLEKLFCEPRVEFKPKKKTKTQSRYIPRVSALELHEEKERQEEFNFDEYTEDDSFLNWIRQQREKLRKLRV